MRFSHFLLALLVVAIWGFNFVVIKIGLKEIPPLTLCFMRFFLASIPAVFFIKKPATPIKMIVCYGLVMFVCQFSLLFTGMRLGVTAGMASLLLQAQVFITLLFAVVFMGEKPTIWQLSGALISFIGILIVGLNMGGNYSVPGFFLVIAAAVSWSVGNIITKKIGQVNMFSLVVWGSLISWPPLLLIAFLLEGGDKIAYEWQHVSWLSLASVAYIVYLSTLSGYVGWSWLISRYPMTTVAPFMLLVPIFGMLSSFLVLGEALQFWKILAALLVIFGLGVNLLGAKLMRNKLLKLNAEQSTL